MVVAQEAILDEHVLEFLGDFCLLAFDLRLRLVDLALALRIALRILALCKVVEVLLSVTQPYDRH